MCVGVHIHGRTFGQTYMHEELSDQIKDYASLILMTSMQDYLQVSVSTNKTI